MCGTKQKLGAGTDVRNQTYIGHVLVSVNPFRDCTFISSMSSAV